MEKTKKTPTSIIVLSFLILEVLAFVGFSLGNSFIIYGLVGIVTLFLILFFTNIQFKKEGKTTLLQFAIPLIIFAALTILSGFGRYFDLLTNFFVPLSFVAFAGVGYFATQYKEFKLKYAFFAIYGSIALLTFISYIYTMIQFVPFYTIIYRNSYIFFDGAPSRAPIGEIAYFLMGFSFMEVSVDFFSLFPSVLATSIVALFFINPRKEKKTFLIYVLFAAIGWIPLITMPTKMTILSTAFLAIVLAIVILGFKGIIKSKAIKYITYSFVGVVSVVFLFTLLNANLNLGFVQNNPLLNKIFNANGLATSFNFVLGNIFKGTNFLGFNFVQFIEHGYDGFYGLSNSWFFDNFIYSGVIGFILFIAVIYFGIKAIKKFFIEHDEPQVNKVLLVSFILGFLTFTLIAYDAQPYINYMNYIPYYMTGPFLICIFLMGYVFRENNKNDEVVNENTTDTISIGGDNYEKEDITF